MKRLLLNKKIKYVLIAFVLLVTVLMMWRYINTYLYKSKAANSIARITFHNAFPVDLSKTAIVPSEEFYLPVEVVAVNSGEKISAIDLRLTYNPDVQYIPFDLQNQVPLVNFDEKVVETPEPGKLRIVLVAKKAIGNLSHDITMNFKFKSSSVGTINFQIDKANTVVVGSAVTPKFDFDDTGESTKDVIVGGMVTGPGSGTIPAETNTPVPSQPPGSCIPLNGQCIGQEQCCSPLICFQAGIGGLCLEPTSTPPPTDSCTTNPDVCLDTEACVGGTCGTPGCTIPTGDENAACYDKTYTGHACTVIRKNNGTSCGDNKSCMEGVCTEQETGTPPVSPSPASGVTLDLKLHFQGIIGSPATDRNAMQVKFTVAGGGLAQSMVKTGDFISDGAGIWTGSINFPDLQAGTYTIFIKGPRHVQKKICDASPNDQGIVGRYFCRAGSAGVTLTMGANNLDFSNIWLLSGDLPLADGGQDGVIDSKDVSYIRNNLGVKTDTVCDINLDGICDSQDYSLLYKSLEVKYDEE